MITTLSFPCYRVWKNILFLIKGFPGKGIVIRESQGFRWGIVTRKWGIVKKAEAISEIFLRNTIRNFKSQSVKECLSWTLTSKLLEHVQVIRAFQVERNSHDHSRNKEWLRKGQGIVGKISWIKLQLNVIYLTSLIIFLHLLARQI